MQTRPSLPVWHTGPADCRTRGNTLTEYFPSNCHAAETIHHGRPHQRLAPTSPNLTP